MSLVLLPLFFSCALASEAETRTDEFYIRSSDVQIFVRRAEPVSRPVATVLALHGGPGVSHGHLEVLERLVGDSHLRVVNFDQRGTGLSSAPASLEKYRMDDYVADVAAVRASVADGPVFLLGHSWGGLLAMVYAARNPGNVVGLILVNPAPQARTMYSKGFDRRIDELQEAGLIPDPLPEMGENDCTSWLKALLPALYMNPLELSPSSLAKTTCATQAHRETWRQLAQYDFRSETPRIDAPVLYIWGDRDAYGMDQGVEITRYLPANTDMRIIPQCGHRPMHECPDRFFPLVQQFVAGSISSRE